MTDLKASLSAFSVELTNSAADLVSGRSNSRLSLQATSLLKLSTDHSLKDELSSFSSLSSLLNNISSSSTSTSTSSSNTPTTRSASASTSTTTPKNQLQLQPTPINELTVDGMDHEMIWDQLEMRNSTVVGLLDDMLGGGSGEDSEGEEEDGFDQEDSDAEEDEDEDEDEEPSSEIEEEPSYHALKDTSSLSPLPSKRRRTSSNPDSSQQSLPTSTSPFEDTEDDLNLLNFDDLTSTTKSKKNAKSGKRGKKSEVDDDFFSLEDFNNQVAEGEMEMDKALRGEFDDDDDDDEDDGVDLFSAGGSARRKSGRSGAGEDSEEEESEEEESEDEANLDAAGIMFNDFFAPPPSSTKPKPSPSASASKAKGKGKALPTPTPSSQLQELEPDLEVSPSDQPRKIKVRFSDQVKVKTIAARKNSGSSSILGKYGLDDEDDGEEEEEEEEEESDLEEWDDEDIEKMMAMDGDGMEDEGSEDEDEEMEGLEEEEEEGSEDEGESDNEIEPDDSEGQKIEKSIKRIKTSLFDEDEEEEPSDKPAPGSHARRLLLLSQQIASLEAENVGEKNWATKGEAKAKDRPMNALLEEDLEFERAGKVVPVAGEELTQSIEELIKKRILDNQFDDVVRQRPVDPHAFLPSRFMELQDTKSQKSLAEIYEDEFVEKRAAQNGETVMKEVDKELEEKHQEIEDLFDELAGKLDALSNARFTPKPPKATISTISNVASISLESALPTTSSTSTLLAPEEIHVPDASNQDRSDFTPAQKKAARQKRRKERAAVAKASEKFKKGEKGDKERAEKVLMGTRGVTVLGKGKKDEGKKRKRDTGDDGGRTSSGVAFKL